MRRFETKRLSVERDTVARDGSDVRVGLSLQGGGMAHFELASDQTSKAVTHKTVEEVWCFLAGHGEMWRRLGDREEAVLVEEGVCVTIPVGTHFQFRPFGGGPLAALAVTMPPWPGEEEAVPVEGKWQPTVLS
jgi:mannose-6-phosphate isomerase-like protein (cupin superfamily)